MIEKNSSSAWSFSGAPRGTGVTSMTSDFAAMNVASSGSATGFDRSSSYSAVQSGASAATQPQGTNKRGMLDNLSYLNN